MVGPHLNLVASSVPEHPATPQLNADRADGGRASALTRNRTYAAPTAPTGNGR